MAADRRYPQLMKEGCCWRIEATMGCIEGGWWVVERGKVRLRAPNLHTLSLGINVWYQRDHTVRLGAD